MFCCERSTGDEVWYTGTYNNAGAFLIMQDLDYHLILKSTTGAGLWLTNVYQNGATGSVFILQNDGNLVQYDARGAVVWASSTNGRR